MIDQQKSFMSNGNVNFPANVKDIPVKELSSMVYLKIK